VQTCQTRSVCKPGPPAYRRDPACIQGPATINTTTLDPRPVFEAQLVFKVRLAFEEIQHMTAWLGLTFTIALLFGHHTERKYRGPGKGAEKSYQNSTSTEKSAL